MKERIETSESTNSINRFPNGQERITMKLRWIYLKSYVTVMRRWIVIVRRANMSCMSLSLRTVLPEEKH